MREGSSHISYIYNTLRLSNFVTSTSIYLYILFGIYSPRISSIFFFSTPIAHLNFVSNNYIYGMAKNLLSFNAICQNAIYSTHTHTHGELFKRNIFCRETLELTVV